MPGLFGLVSRNRNLAVSNLLALGAASIERRPWQSTLRWADAQQGVAVVLNDKKLRGGGLLAAPSQDVVVAFNGELYDGPSLIPPDATVALPNSDCAAYIAALYKRLGPSWIEQVSGAFSGCIIDLHRGLLWLFVDRFGLRPLMFSSWDDRFIFGSTIRSFTSTFPDLGWSLDLSAVVDLFAFEHILGNRTLVGQVRLIPNGEMLKLDLKSFKFCLEQYWSFDQIKINRGLRYSEAVEEASSRFEKAVRRLSRDESRRGVFITSGLDSRTILGAFKRLGERPATYTYGLPSCRDLVWGSKLARIASCDHRSFEFDDGRWVFDNASDFACVAEGFVSLFHSHGISIYRDVSVEIDVHISGFGGGSFAGCDTTFADSVDALGFSEAAKEIYRHYSLNLGSGFGLPIERYMLFNPEVRSQMSWLSEVSFCNEVSKYRLLPSDLVADAFNLNNRYKKMFAYLIAMEREFLEDRSPFFDYDFFSFIMEVPVQLRKDRRLQIGMLDRLAPELTWVPWQVTASLPTNRRWKRRLFDSWRKLSGFFDPLPIEPGRNYFLWLSENGLPWAREIIESKDLRERGILDVDCLRGLLDRVEPARAKRTYQNQRALAFQIGLALSFELACRHIFDGDSLKRT